MAMRAPRNPLVQEDFNGLKVIKCLLFLGSVYLLTAFEWISEKDPAMSFKDFFIDQKKMPKTLYKKYFNKEQRDKMESNPSGESFDVTLLFTIMRWGCERLSQNQDHWKEGNDSSLESNLTMFKNLRNWVLHGDATPFTDDAKMIDCFDKIQKYLEQILRLSAQMAGIGKAEVDDKVKKMKESVEKIKVFPLSKYDIEKYKTEIKELREAQKQIVKEKGVPGLKQEYKTISSVTPLSNFSEIGSLDVMNIYVDAETVSEVVEKKITFPVDSKKILVLPSDCGKKAKFIVVEGEAGAGKSTLVMKMLSDWALDASQGSSPTIEGIDSYDLILYSEFRNHNISSLLCLLKVLLPQPSSVMDDKDLVESVCDLNTLVILDGWDEENEASNKLMRNLLDEIIPRSKDKMELLITTRPTKLPDLPSISQSKPKLHIRLTGFKHGNQLEFIKKLHEELRKQDKSKERTEPLVEYVECSRAQMGEHFSLPLNLALVTYLWATDPSNVNSVTTATELYTALQDMLKLRLIERLQRSGHPGTQKELDKKLEDFLRTLYRVSFQTHASGSVELSQKHFKDLEDKCKEVQLPVDEMCSTFLNVKKEWTPRGYKLSLEAPHKSIFEFFAAFFIFFALSETPNETQDEEAWQDILEKSQLLPMFDRVNIRKCYDDRQGKEVSIQRTLEANLGADLSKQMFNHLENVFLHLGGILLLKGHQNITKYVRELVSFMAKITSHDKARKIKTAFQILSSINNRDDLVDAVVDIMMEDVDELTIRDGEVTSALALLKRRKGLPALQMIRVSLSSDKSPIPELKALLDEVSYRECMASLILEHHWRNLIDGSDIVKHLITPNRKCKVIELKTHLEDFSLVPCEAEWVWLGLSTNTSERIVKSIGGHERERIAVNISLSQYPQSLTHLSEELKGGLIFLFIRDVSDGDVDRVVEAVCKLRPVGDDYDEDDDEDDDDDDDDDDDEDDDDDDEDDDEVPATVRKLLCSMLFRDDYTCISFPESSLTRSGTESLIRRFAQEGISLDNTYGLRVCSPFITAAEEKELQDICLQQLHCRFLLLPAFRAWTMYIF